MNSIVERHPPRLRELNERQMQIVLTRNHVGRIAFVVDRQVELQPVHYVYEDGGIYGRTAFGGKYIGMLMQPCVVFEVDESAGLFDWRSVIVRGRVRVLRPRGTRGEPSEYLNAVTALRTLVRETLKPADPMPHRTAIFRIDPESMTGREARPT